MDPRNFILTWDDNPSWDDVVPVERRNLIDELIEKNEGKEICPHLKQLGKRFFSCGAQAILSKNYESTEEPTINSAEYNSQLDHFSLQLWCMEPKERYSKCVVFQDAEDKIIDV